MAILDDLRIGTVYTIGLNSEEKIENVSQIVLYNKQTKKRYEATTPSSLPATILAGSVFEVAWNSTKTKDMDPGIYSVQIYTGSGSNVVCVLDEECVRAKIVAASNTYSS